MVISEKHLYCLHHITGKFAIEMYVTTALLLLPQHHSCRFDACMFVTDIKFTKCNKRNKVKRNNGKGIGEHRGTDERKRERKTRGRERERWLFNLCGEWERVAVIHGFVSQLIKERKFLKNIQHREIWPPYITYLQTTRANIHPWEGQNDPHTHKRASELTMT